MPHILFYVTAKDCPACKAFAPHWEALEAALRKAHPDLDIESVVYEKRSASGLDTTKYPMELMQYIGWFPSFVLVPKDAYAAVRARTRRDLPAVVFNGKAPAVAGGLIESVRGKERLPLNSTTLQAWVKRETTPSSSVAAAPPPPPAPLPDVEDVCTRLRLVSRFTRPVKN